MRGILLVRPYDLDTRAIDIATGSHGYGHVGIFAGEFAARYPVGIDASFDEQKISRRYLFEIVKGSKWDLLPLSAATLMQTYRAAQQRIGQPYNNLGLLGVHSPEKATCSQLIYECLPEWLRARIPTWRSGWCSPNCLAKWGKSCGFLRS